jgi:hypothetical protein
MGGILVQLKSNTANGSFKNHQILLCILYKDLIAFSITQLYENKW